MMKDDDDIPKKGIQIPMDEDSSEIKRTLLSKIPWTPEELSVLVRLKSLIDMKFL